MAWTMWALLHARYSQEKTMIGPMHFPPFIMAHSRNKVQSRYKQKFQLSEFDKIRLTVYSYVMLSTNLAQE